MEDAAGGDIEVALVDKREKTREKRKREEMEDTAGSDSGNSDRGSRNNIEVALVDKELMHMVFGFVGFTDLPSLALVCRRWLVLSRADEVMRALLVGRVQSMCLDAHHTGLGYEQLPAGSAQRLRVIWALAHETIVQISTTAVSYDKQHTLALTADGEVYAFGDNTDDKLGLEDVAAGSSVIYKPALVSMLEGEKIIKVAAAGAHSAALSSRGSVFTWGYSGNCRLGLVGRLGMSQLGLSPAPSARTVSVPTEVMCIGDSSHNGGGAEVARPFIVDLWCGQSVTLLLDDQGVLYSFGVTSCLGRPSRQDNQNGFEDGLPQPVALPAGVKIKSAAMGRLHGLAIATDGQVYSWGNNSNGQLGHSDREHLATPEVVSALGGKRAVQVACSTQHSLVLTEDNVLYSLASSKVCIVDLVKGMGPITAISAAQKRSVVLFESGRVVELLEGAMQLCEIKPENWIVPRGICAGDLNSTFIVY